MRSEIGDALVVSMTTKLAVNDVADEDDDDGADDAVDDDDDGDVDESEVDKGSEGYAEEDDDGGGCDEGSRRTFSFECIFIFRHG